MYAYCYRTVTSFLVVTYEVQQHKQLVSCYLSQIVYFCLSLCLCISVCLHVYCMCVCVAPVVTVWYVGAYGQGHRATPHI